MVKIKKVLPIICAVLLAVQVYPVRAEEASTESSEEVTEEETEGTEESEEAAEPDNRIIPEFVTIAGLDVAGKTVDEAMAMVNESFSYYDDVVFTLNADGETVNATGKDLSICAKNKDVAVKAATYGTYGNIAERFKASKDMDAGRKKDFSVSIGADVSGVIEYLESIEDSVGTKPVNNSVVRSNGSFTYVPGSSGNVLQVSQSASDIVDFIENDWDGENASIDLTLVVEEPQGTEEELATITEVLGSFNTDYSTSSSERKNNVANGARLVNGTVLYPGEEFSVLSAITPFTAENGYELAGSYENGTTVETYGGGICQVSTTLYGAVRAAEVEVVTRSCHSMVVNYVQPSQDAAISESGSKDFQIKNNKETPIYIEGYTDGSKIYFNIWGREDRESTHSVEYETEITEVNVQDTVWVADPSLPLGTMKTTTSGHTGYKARLWKITYENGEETERHVYNNSTYNPSSRTVAVGTASASADLSNIMASAVATQDVDTIANTIATYAPGVANTTPYVITPKYSVTVQEDTVADDGITNDASAVDENTGEVVAQ